MVTAVESLSQQYKSSWERERAKVRALGRLCTLATILIIGTLFFFLIYLERWSSSLIVLSFFVIFTNLGRWVVYRLYLVPRFFRILRTGTDEEKHAAWAVIDAHRDTMLKPIVVEQRAPSKPEDIAALTMSTVAGWKDIDKIEWWETFARRWLVVWFLGAAALVIMLLALL